METTKRNYRIDVLKGLAVFLMVVGHCIQFGSGIHYFEEKQYFYNIIFKMIYSFHMPLFMIISGYLFYYSYSKYSINELIRNKIKRFIYPIVI